MISQANISVNKLAEFIVSRGARQREILRQRKYPDPDFSIGMYHREASEAASQYLAAGAQDPEPLRRRIQSLSQSTSDKVGTARRANANIDAIETLLDMLDDIDLLDAEPSLGGNTAPKIRRFNVDISVRPEIIMRGSLGKGKRGVGALKLHFSKTHPHTEETAGYVSAIVQEYCGTHLVHDDDEGVNPKYCQVIDVASGTVFGGVKSTMKRMKDVDAACQNIAALWPTI
jgi:hypothetical protein